MDDRASHAAADLHAVPADGDRCRSGTRAGKPRASQCRDRYDAAGWRKQRSGVCDKKRTAPRLQPCSVPYPQGGVRVTPGQVYTIQLSSSDTVLGWKYVLGGYANGAASFHDYPGRPLSPYTSRTFLFRTFGAN